MTYPLGEKQCDAFTDQHPHQGPLIQSSRLNQFACQTSSSFLLQNLEILPSRSVQGSQGSVGL